MKILPNKLTSKQRADIKLAKLNQSAVKTGIKEAGSTIRSVVSNVAANRTIQKKMSLDKIQSMNNKNIEDALNIYNSLMGGNPSGSGSEGSKQNNSTTEITPTNGSKLGG